MSAGMTMENQASRMGWRPKWPMSAYSASPPVTHSTTAPRMMKVVPGWCAMKRSAWCGLKANKISGWPAMW
ncbi:hypothetical protein ALISP_5218 [Alicycliphilus sp. B1]|nr:hypothetical protein ALISP_5218 [Alicycliphilus sp. B1]